MNRIDGMPTEFEWKIVPGIVTLGLLEKIRSLVRDLQCESEHLTDRIIFMSMYNDIEWGAKGNKDTCEYHSQTVADKARRLWGLDQKKSGNLHWQTRRIMGSNCTEYDDKWFRIRSSNISCLQCLWERRITKQRRGEISQYAWMAVMKTSSCFSERWFLRISSVSTEQ